MVAEALTDPTTRHEAIERLRDTAKNRKTVIPTLEFAARVNREIGIGSEQSTGSVTFTFISNIRPDALRRRGRDRKGGTV